VKGVFEALEGRSNRRRARRTKPEPKPTPGGNPPSSADEPYDPALDRAVTCNYKDYHQHVRSELAKSNACPPSRSHVRRLDRSSLRCGVSELLPALAGQEGSNVRAHGPVHQRSTATSAPQDTRSRPARACWPRKTLHEPVPRAVRDEEVAGPSTYHPGQTHRLIRPSRRRQRYGGCGPALVTGSARARGLDAGRLGG
jgi:hypothetical protein